MGKAEVASRRESSVLLTHKLCTIVARNGAGADIGRVVSCPVVNDHDLYVVIGLPHERAKASHGALPHVVHGHDDAHFWGLTVCHWEATPPLAKTLNGLGGDTSNDCVVRHVVRHDSIGADNHPIANGHAGHNSSALTYPYVVADTHGLGNDLAIVGSHIGQRGVGTVGAVTIIRYKDIGCHEHVVANNDALMGRDMDAVVYLAVHADNERGAVPSEIETARVPASEALPVNEAPPPAAKVKGAAHNPRPRKENLSEQQRPRVLEGLRRAVLAKHQASPCCSLGPSR